MTLKRTRIGVLFDDSYYYHPALPLLIINSKSPAKKGFAKFQRDNTGSVRATPLSSASSTLIP